MSVLPKDGLRGLFFEKFNNFSWNDYQKLKQELHKVKTAKDAKNIPAKEDVPRNEQQDLSFHEKHEKLKQITESLTAQQLRNMMTKIPERLWYEGMYNVVLYYFKTVDS